MTPPFRPASDTSATPDQAAVPTPLLAAVGQHLRATIGLDIERLGEETVARAIRRAWPDALAAETGPMGDRLTAGSVAWQRLIDAIVVSESWFLREPRVFAHAAAVVERVLQRQPRVTILSAPCAAGEEAYSLSLSLLEAGVAPDRFRIVGTDISAKAIAAARRGSYTDNAFRATAASLRDRWFRQTPAGWEVITPVRQPVQFIEANLLDPNGLGRLQAATGAAFDLICCRNLLIYLTTTARETLEDTLQQLLGPDGEVIVGAAETTILPVARWQPSGPLAFARRPQSPTTPARPLTTRPVARRQSLPGSIPPLSLPAERSSRPAVAKPAAEDRPSPSLPAAVDPVVEAETLANTGDIAAAIAHCQQALERNAVQPAVLFLQAMLQQSQGATTAAERLLEKVVYLEPHHEGALLALALAAGRRGDTAAERRYRRRAAAAAESAP